jgi:chemotaxis response regulator CheB
MCAGNIRKDKMTVDELQEMFEKYQDDVSLDRLGVEMLGSKRDDLHAFELLDKLVPGKRGMVSGADHDVIYLDVELDDLKDIITDPQVVELVKCGVFFDHDVDCLAMFV